MSKPLLIAMVGLPRSGKSTIVKDLSKRLGAPIVRRDAIRLALTDERYVHAAEPIVKAISLYMIRSLFLAGHEVVICDETNYSREARASIMDPRWEICFYEVPTDVQTCIERAYITGQPDLEPVIREMAARYVPLSDSDARFVELLEDGTIVTSHTEMPNASNGND